MKVTILVGTMTGTAQLCAQEMELALDDGEPRSPRDDGRARQRSVQARRGVPVCTSTYGRATSRTTPALYEHLQSASPTCRRCATAYSAWATAPTPRPSTSAASAFDEILAQLGAKRIGERHMHDASSGILPERPRSSGARHGSPR
jgi:MioC protein